MLDKRLLTLVAKFGDMNLDEILRGIANTMAHGMKKTRPLECEEDEMKQTQPPTKRHKF